MTVPENVAFAARALCTHTPHGGPACDACVDRMTEYIAERQAQQLIVDISRALRR